MASRTEANATGVRTTRDVIEDRDFQAEAKAKCVKYLRKMKTSPTLTNLLAALRSSFHYLHISL
jgi:hypothetical protein